MSLENAKLFLEKVISDGELRKDVQKKESVDVLAKAKELGYECTAEELDTAVEEYRKGSGNSDTKLEAQDLDHFAGGYLWQGDEASDGHEMGCLLTYHSYSWSEENNEYCSSSYYCTASRYELM